MVAFSSLRGKEHKEGNRFGTPTNPFTSPFEAIFPSVRRVSEPIGEPSEVTFRGLKISNPVPTTLPSEAELYPNGTPRSVLPARTNVSVYKTTSVSMSLLEISYLCTNYKIFVKGHFLERSATLNHDERCKECGDRLFDGSNNEWKKWVLFAMSETEDEARIRVALHLDRKRRLREMARARGEVTAHRNADYESEERIRQQDFEVVDPSVNPNYGMDEGSYQEDHRAKALRKLSMLEHRNQKNMTEGRVYGRFQDNRKVEPRYQNRNMNEGRRHENRQPKDSLHQSQRNEIRRQHEDRQVKNHLQQNQSSENSKHQEHYQTHKRSHQSNDSPEYLYKYMHDEAPEHRFANRQIHPQTKQRYEAAEKVADDDEDVEWQTMTTINNIDHPMPCENFQYQPTVTDDDYDDDELYHRGNPYNPRYYLSDPVEDQPNAI